MAFILCIVHISRMPVTSNFHNVSFHLKKEKKSCLERKICPPGHKDSILHLEKEKSCFAILPNTFRNWMQVKILHNIQYLIDHIYFSTLTAWFQSWLDYSHSKLGDKWMGKRLRKHYLARNKLEQILGQLAWLVGFKEEWKKEGGRARRDSERARSA